MNQSRKRNRGTGPSQRLTPEAKAAVAHVKPLAKPKRRLRSTYVILGSVGTLVAGACIYGIVRGPDRTCVDVNNNAVIDRSECERGGLGARWYYGGSNDGGRMTGGSFDRGGFGGHGGGGS